MIKSLLKILLRNKRLTGILLSLATLTILYLTLSPADQIGDFTLYQYDKLGHFALFFGWTFFLGLLILSYKETNTNLLAIFMTGALFGISIEILQGILPFGRSADMSDAFADILGTICATILLFYIRKHYRIFGEEIVKKS